MAAVVIVRRRSDQNKATDNEGQKTTEFTETLPPAEVREMDVVMGTLLLG